jgi:hypothetical protein
MINPLQSPDQQRTTSFQYILFDIIRSIHSRRQKEGGRRNHSNHLLGREQLPCTTWKGSRREEKSTPITCSAKNNLLAPHEWTQGRRKNPLHSPVRYRTISLHYIKALKGGGKTHSNHPFGTERPPYTTWKKGGEIHFYDPFGKNDLLLLHTLWNHHQHKEIKYLEHLLSELFKILHLMNQRTKKR